MATISLFKSYAKKERYKHEIIGINGRLDGIQATIHHPLELHLQEAFKLMSYKNGDLPNTKFATHKELFI